MAGPIRWRRCGVEASPIVFYTNRHFSAALLQPDGDMLRLGKTVELPIATDERRGGERHVAVRSHGEHAVTTFGTVKFFGNLATLVEVDLGTGKTHQIRVHAAYAGHPVAGDDKYGDREQNARLRELGLHRMFLHAASIGFLRPGTHEPCNGSAPLDAELGAFLDALGDATARRRRRPGAGVRTRAAGAGPRGAGRR